MFYFRNNKFLGKNLRRKNMTPSNVGTAQLISMYYSYTVMASVGNGGIVTGTPEIVLDI